MIVHLCFSRIFEKRFSFILTSVLKKIKNVPLLRAVVVAPRWVDLRLRNNNVKNDDSRPDSRGNKFVTNISELELIATTARRRRVVVPDTGTRGRRYNKTWHM